MFASRYTPVGRGFDSSYGFLFGSTDHVDRGAQESHICGAAAEALNRPRQLEHSRGRDGEGGRTGGVHVGGESKDCFDLYNSSHAARGAGEGTAYATNRVYSADIYAAEATKLIAAHGRQQQREQLEQQQHGGQGPSPTPLFLYLAFQNAHSPYEVPRRYLDRYPGLNGNRSSRACFNSMVSALDDAVGAVVAALKSAEMFDRTIIIYSGDNGSPGHQGNNMPLKGAKYTTLEGGLRVPAFFYSEMLPATARGAVSHALMSSVDWYVTLAGLAGVSSTQLAHSGPVDQPPAGIDVLPLILSATKAGDDSHKNNRTIVHELDDMNGFYAIRHGAFKLIWGDINPSSPGGVGAVDYVMPDIDWPAGGDIGKSGGAWCQIVPERGAPTASSAVAADSNVLTEGTQASSPVEAPPPPPPLVANMTCTAQKMCLFNVQNDESEMADPHALAAANPHIVADLLARLRQANASRYLPGLDLANASEADWCAVVRRRKWIEPYCDGSGNCEGVHSGPPPPPAPPPQRPSGKPSATQAKAWSGTWQLKKGESAAISASSNGSVHINATGCAHCCWKSASGTVGANDEIAITLVGKTTGSCTGRNYSGHLQAISGGSEITWDHWTSEPWRKIRRSDSG